MKAAKDIIIVVFVISLMVTSTAAWYYGGLTYEGTNPYAINFVDTGFIVTQSEWVYSGNSKVILTLALKNDSTETEYADLEIQPLDINGDIILDKGVNMTQYASTGNISPGDSWSDVFEFQKSHIRTDLNVFQILITGQDTFVPGDKLSSFNIEQTIYASGGGTTLPVRSMIGYIASSPPIGNEYPKYRYYDNAWSDEIQFGTQASDSVREIRLDFNPNQFYNDRAVMVVLTNNGYLDAYDYNGYSWSAPTTLARLWLSAPSEPARSFDIAFEKTSGDFIVLYSNVLDNTGSQDLAYRIWDGASWSSEYYLDDPKSSSANTRYMWVQLASSLEDGTDNIGFVGIDNNNLEYASAVWDGSSWGSWNRITTSPTLWRESAAIEWEYTSGDCMVAVSTGTQVRYQIWDGTWNTASNLALESGGDDWVWLRLKSHKVSGSDRLMLLGLDDGQGVSAVDWDGNGWNGVGNILDQRMETSDTRCIDGDWEPSGTKFLVAGGNRNTDQLSYKTWTPSTGWSHSTNNWGVYTSGYDNDQRWMQVKSNPAGDEPLITIAWIDDKNDLVIAEWNGATMLNGNELTAKSQNSYEGYEIAYSWR